MLSVTVNGVVRKAKRTVDSVTIRDAQGNEILREAGPFTQVFRDGDHVGRAEITVTRARDVEEDARLEIARLNVTINDLYARIDALEAERDALKEQVRRV